VGYKGFVLLVGVLFFCLVVVVAGCLALLLLGVVGVLWFLRCYAEDCEKQIGDFP
jgi:hypothetical protein